MHDAYENFMNDPKGFETLISDAKKPLYLYCTKFTKLSTLVNLLIPSVRFYQVIINGLP